MKKNKIIIALCFLFIAFVQANDAKPFDYAYASYVDASSSDLRMYELGARFDLPFKPIKRSITYLQFGFAGWSSMQNSNDRLTVISIAPLLRYKIQVYNAMFQPYIDLSLGFAYLSRKDFGGYSLSSAIRMQDSIALGVMFGENKQYDLGIGYTYYNRVGFVNGDKEINAVPRLILGYSF
jgi:hypothetical protein